MSGSGRKVFQPGEVLTASNVQNYLQDQAVMVFAGTAERGTALGAGTVTAGMMSYLQDSNTVEVYKTSGTAIEGWEAPYPVSPNVIINGDFSINQRNFTSVTTNNSYGFDRWFLASQDSTTATYTPQTFTVGTVLGDDTPKKYARIEVAGQSTNGAYSILRQHIEDVTMLAGKTVTVSFWAKSGSGAPKISVEIGQTFGTGGSTQVNTNFGAVTISTNWVRYSVTGYLADISGKTLGPVNTSSTLLSLWVSGGSDYNSRINSIGNQNNTFDIWGVQVEAGQTATAFRRNAPSIQAELAACQRYYFRYTSDSTTTTYILSPNAAAASTTSGYVVFNTPVPMRIAPTAIDWDGTPSHYTMNEPGVTSISLSATPTLSAVQTSNTSILMFTTTAGGLNAGRVHYFRANAANVGAYIGFSAEL